MSTAQVLADSIMESAKVVGDNKSRFAREHGLSLGCLRWRLDNNWPSDRLGEDSRKPVDYGSYIGREFGNAVIDNILDGGVYKRSGNKRMIVECHCKKCGHHFTVVLHSLLDYNAQERCPKCRKNNRPRNPYNKERIARNSMIYRCYNPKCENYKIYGGRGITVCDRWRESFDNFIADMGPCPPGYSLDRIDVNGNYEPSNCRWADNKTQGNNRRVNHMLEYNGVKMTLQQWADLLGVQSQRIRTFVARHNDDISPFIEKLAKDDPSILSKVPGKEIQCSLF